MHKFINLYIKSWDKFVEWYWPNFLRNNLIIAIVYIILVWLAKTK